LSYPRQLESVLIESGPLLCPSPHALFKKMETLKFYKSCTVFLNLVFKYDKKLKENVFLKLIEYIIILFLIFKSVEANCGRFLLF
jgi:hypothetical protein